MISPGPDDQIYPVFKIAKIVGALKAEGVSVCDALADVNVSQNALAAPETRVSLNQMIACFSNAQKLSRDPHFAYHMGLQHHLTDYGIFGFAILSSTDVRQMMYFGQKYRQLSAPLVDLFFKEEGNLGILTIVPLPHPHIDASLYKFLVEMRFGGIVSRLRDILGPNFGPRELNVTYGPPDDAANYPELFGCKVLFNQSENRFIFDAIWLDRKPELASEVVHSMIVEMCEGLMEEFRSRIGLSGQVRQILSEDLTWRKSFNDVACHLNLSTRSLRRKLQEEDTSFRKLGDEVRMAMAIKFLRDTNINIEDIAHTVGFSEVTSFRHAFYRWTKTVPHRFRDQFSKATCISNG